jgi:hypothetical protein
MTRAQFDPVGAAPLYGFHFSTLVAIVFMVMGYSRRCRCSTPWWSRCAATARGHALTAAPAGGCAGRGRGAGGGHRGDLRLRGHHRRRHHADRPRPEVLDIAIQAAGGQLVVTAVYTALIVWVVGLAVPVTASYIICAVVAAPALMKLGVPDYAAHMFVFYYAVLSEVSPPTALSPSRRARSPAPVPTAPR